MSNSNLGSVSPKGYNNITKKDIIAKVAKKSNISQEQAKQVVDTYWEVIKNALKKNKKANITIPTVGSIRCVKTKSRTYKISGLKYTTKKVVKKESKITPKFYVSDKFLDSATEKTKSKPKTKAKSTSKTTKSKTNKKKK